MPEYDRDRHNYNNNERGRIFENGAAQYFRDSENGYVQQSRIFRDPNVGNVRFDKIRDDRGLILTIEEKSGRVDSKKDRSSWRLFERFSTRVKYSNTYSGPSRANTGRRKLYLER